MLLDLVLNEFSDDRESDVAEEKMNQMKHVERCDWSLMFPL